MLRNSNFIGFHTDARLWISPGPKGWVRLSNYYKTSIYELKASLEYNEDMGVYAVPLPVVAQVFGELFGKSWNREYLSRTAYLSLDDAVDLPRTELRLQAQVRAARSNESINRFAEGEISATLCELHAALDSVLIPDPDGDFPQPALLKPKEGR